MRMKRGDPFGNRDVKLIEIRIVAAPRERLAVNSEDHAHNVIGETVRPVMAGYPLGSSQRERPALTGRSTSV